jgi:hypothetical protein
VGSKIAKAHRAKQTPHGKQTVKKLMAHGTSTNSLELSGDTKLFDRVARKWNVDYAFYQTEPGKYLLFFKSGQADAMTACFSEYSRKVLDISLRWGKQYEEDKIISKDILIYICNDAFNFLYSALVDFPNCACPKCSCHEYISDKCRGEHFVRSRYAPAHYSNHVENISDFYTLLRRYIGIVFILLFQRHNHSDFIALKIC